MIAQQPATAGLPAAVPRPEGAAEAPPPSAGEARAGCGEDFAALIAATSRRPGVRIAVDARPDSEPAAAEPSTPDATAAAVPVPPMPAAELLPAPASAAIAGEATAAAPDTSAIVSAGVTAGPGARSAAASARESKDPQGTKPATVPPGPPDPTKAEPAVPSRPAAVAATGGRLRPAETEPSPADPAPAPDAKGKAQPPEAGAAPRVPAAGGPLPTPGAAADERAAPLGLQPAAPAAWHLARGPEQPVPDAVPAPPPAAHPAPQPVVGQVAVAIARANEQRVEIRLDPPELGRVQIHLTPIDGGVQAVVLADRPETQDLLRRHAGSLAQELGDAGFGNVSLDFATGHQATPDTPERPQPTFEPVFAAPSPVPAMPLPATRNPTAAGGLDIRL